MTPWDLRCSIKGDTKKRLRCTPKAVKLNPKDSAAYDNWGIALRYEGKYEEAIGKVCQSD